MSRTKTYFVYIMANEWNTVLYVGVTNDIQRRINEHKCGEGSVFTRKYKVNKLVYAEEFRNIDEAIRAEKSLKRGTRARKIKFIESVNPQWKDLANSW
ncbi:MAG: GIY-YIG nuclease family protein [bacterium]